MVTGYAKGLISRKGLSLALCRLAMEVALESAEKRGLRVTVAIMDAGGALQSLARMDLTHAGSVDVAIAKARCAAMNKVTTKVFSDLHREGMTAITALGVLPFEGGVPIILDDDIVGSIGVSGGSPESDGEIASVAAQVIISSGISL